MEQEPQTPRERADDLIRLLVPDWRPNDQQVLWGIRIVLAFVIVLGVLTLIGRPFGITPWQWLDLLIIPAVLAIGGYLFTRSENRASRVVAERRAQDEALQAYLDQMSDMMLPNNDQPTLSDEHPPDNLKTVARARTLTVLPRLDGDGKARVVQFLYEACLNSCMVRDEQGEMVVREKVVDLSGANLRDANLFGLVLTGVALDNVNLERAALRLTDLQNADLSFAYLRDANLESSVLSGADFTAANLSGASLPGAQLTSDPDIPERLKVATKAAKLTLAYLNNADLDGADLSNADLRYAELPGAQLREADLSGADLTDARGWTEEQLDQAKSLDGATMPDGRVLKGPENPNGPTFEEWRESREGQG
jgi:uncharacterized protein YjbI with pentapeptide repeats